MAERKVNRLDHHLLDPHLLDPLELGTDGALVPTPPPASPQRRWMIRRWLATGVGLILLLILGYVVNLGVTAWNVSNSIYKPLPTLVPDTPIPGAPGLAGLSAGGGIGSDLPVVEVEETVAPGQPTHTPRPLATPDPADALPLGRINILVLGTDKRNELGAEAARSDTLIIVSVDPQWKTAGILSIPRDLNVPIPHYGIGKINSAYFLGEYNKLIGGGPALSVPTVSKFFKVPIQYYVTINFDGFRKIVDEVGGITVFVPEEIDDPKYPGPYNSYIHVHFPAGCQYLTGEEALQYARTRHTDADFGRSRRQQQVIKAIREKGLTLNMLPRYPDLLNDLGSMLETNIPPDKQWAFAQLAGSIHSEDIYTAQIDSTMVRDLDDQGNIELIPKRAQPMLSWFFGRGDYARVRPGTVLTPVPGPTAIVAVRAPDPSPTSLVLTLGDLGPDPLPGWLPTATPGSLGAAGVEDPLARPSPTATPTPLIPGETILPEGSCR